MKQVVELITGGSVINRAYSVLFCFVKKNVQGEAREKKYRRYGEGLATGQAAVQGVNRLNQAQCG